MESYYADGGDLIHDPVDNTVLYSGGAIYTGSVYYMALSKSTNSGVSWTRDTLASGYYVANALAVNPSNRNVVYAGSGAGLYKSTDAGMTWLLSSTGLTGTVYDIAVSAAKGDLLYAGTSSGVFKSTDAAATWTNTGCTNVYDVLINPANPSEIYAGTYNGVYKSTTGGGGWTAMNTGLGSTYVTSLGIYQNNYLYAGTDAGGMYRWNLTIGAAETETDDPPPVFSVSPNPSAGGVHIRFQINEATAVGLAIYDVSGRLVKTLVSGQNGPGCFHETWDGRNSDGRAVASGVYFCRLDTDTGTLVRKLTITK